MSHESIGGLIEYSSSSTSGVAVGTEFPVIDVAVSVGVVMVACDVVGAMSGFSEPPETAESVSSFSSLRKKTILIKSELVSARSASSYTSDFVSSFVLLVSPSFFFLLFFLDLAFSRRLRRKPETVYGNQRESEIH